MLSELHPLEDGGGDIMAAGRFPKDQLRKPSEEERQRVLVLLHKIHTAGGHPSNRSLAETLKKKGCADWILAEALKLACVYCDEASRGNQLRVPASLDAPLLPWQIVGLDAFELPFPSQQTKARYLLTVELTMCLGGGEIMKVDNIRSRGIDGGEALFEAFCSCYLQHRPKPIWVLVDPQTSLAQGKFLERLRSIGIGLGATPGEAHWMLGDVERRVQTIKRTMKKLRANYTDMSPAAVFHLAINAHNNLDRAKGFAPFQWAYGRFCDEQSDSAIVNANRVEKPDRLFWQLEKYRVEAEVTFQREKASERITKLLNAAPRPLKDYQVGDWVCVWRLLAGRREQDFSPEAMFVGPGRVAMIEPALLPENKAGFIWVVMGTRIWKCSSEQLRPANEKEVSLVQLQKENILNMPITDIVKSLKEFEDLTSDVGHVPEDMRSLPKRPRLNGEELERELTPGASGSGSTADARVVQVPMSGVNAPPPEMPLHPADIESDDEVMVDDKHSEDEVTTAAQHKVRVRLRGKQDPTARWPKVKQSIYKPRFGQSGENNLAIEEFAELDPPTLDELEIEEIHAVTQEDNDMEVDLMNFLDQDHLYENENMVMEIAIELDVKKFIDNPEVFLTQELRKVASNKRKEVNYRRLDETHRALFREAMAREIAEHLKADSVRYAKAFNDFQFGSRIPTSRLLRMRWLLCWKRLEKPEPPNPADGPPVITKEGDLKAKARVVLLGFQHPELTTRDEHGVRTLLTAAPTISRTGKHLLLQSAALHSWTLELADAKSAFLQAGPTEAHRKIYTNGVPELKAAFGVDEDTALRVLNAIYGVTNAPRIFWKDADSKFVDVAKLSRNALSGACGSTNLRRLPR